MDLLNSNPEISIDAGDDRTVRNVVIVNLVIEALVTLGTFALMATASGIGQTLARQIKRDVVKWRTKTFGSPPPSEEDLRRYEKLAVVEAMRIVRQAES